MRGTIFAILDAGLLVTSAVSYSLFRGQRRRAIRDGRAQTTPNGLLFQPGYEEDAMGIKRMQTTAFVTLWVGVAAVIAGVVEALISYPGDAVVFEEAS